jgi:hypothetical protein
MTLATRVHAVEGLGFTTRQAGFLVQAALHSGYCVRRQYAAFADVAYGKNVRDFLDSLVTRHLARRFQIRADRGHLYHLHARALYRVVGQEDNRNRREVSAAVVARRLMVLDYVLSHHEVEWLATEADKVAAFTSRLRVPQASLPQHLFTGSQPGDEPRVRYFPNKLPLAVVGNPPVATFVALVTDTSGQSFDQFLNEHASLFLHLPAWAVVAIGPRHTLGIANCDEVFERFLRSPRMRLAGHVDDLQWYFRCRRTVDAGELSRLSMGDIERFRKLRPAFSGPAFEVLYRAWSQGGDRVLEAQATAQARGNQSVGRFSAEPLVFDYSQFGSLPGVA